MSIPYSGTFRRSAGLLSAITKQLKYVNLKPVTKITVTFDPFHHNATSIRDFLFHIASHKVQRTNPNCLLKTGILCNREEPIVSFSLGNGESVKFKSGNLTTLEILQLYNKHITPLAPVEEKPSVQTKSGKAGSKKRK